MARFQSFFLWVRYKKEKKKTHNIIVSEKRGNTGLISVAVLNVLHSCSLIHASYKTTYV